MSTMPVDWESALEMHSAFWNWYKIATKIPWANRSPNMPSEITEAMVCLCTGAELITSGNGDIWLPDETIGEVKGTVSDTTDLSSFSPSETFDNLFFVHMAPGDTNIYFVYDLHMNRQDIGKIKVNRTETFDDHARQGRRPRFSVIDSIISPRSLKPTWKVDIVNKKIN